MGDKKDPKPAQEKEREEGAEDLTLTDEKADDVRGGHWPDASKKK
jgi:hypothetical protein